MLTYRLAGPKDAAPIAALAATVWITTYATAGVEPAFARHVLTEFTEPRWRDLLAAPGRICWLAEQADAVVGFVELTLQAPAPVPRPSRAPAEIARLYVLERFTGQGIGRTLLRHGATSARTRGADELWLTVYEGNARALAFYRRTGWRDAGEYAFPLEGATYRNLLLAAAPDALASPASG